MRRLSSPANMNDSGLASIARQRSPLHNENVYVTEFQHEREPADLVAKNAALEQLNEEKIRWILAAAHDLLNKVNTVQAITEMLVEDSSLQASHRSTLEAVEACTDSMTRLLQDFEEIARAELKKPWLELALAPLLPVVQESIGLSRPAAEKKRIQVKLTCIRPIARLPIDTAKLLHGLLNILHYFIRYSRAGGNINAVVDQDDARVLISFSDYGLAIPDEELQDLFTPFHRSRMHSLAADDETFLGLAICKRIIEQHGGDIWAESREGGGACMRIALPLPGASSRRRRKSQITEGADRDQFVNDV